MGSRLTPLTAQGATAAAPALPNLPALVSGRVRHTRRVGIKHSFDHHHDMWLLDLDHGLPRWLRPLIDVRASDHLSGPSTLAELKANVHRILARHGIESNERRDRVVLLSGARVLGHVFDPMSAFYVIDATGAMRAVVVEVHNTYGERHAYVVRPDAHGRGHVDKDFYVSPFNDLEGSYRTDFAMTSQDWGVSIVLDRGTTTILEASFTGDCKAVTPRSVAASLRKNPLAPQRVSVLIRLHGIWLWLRRLPIRPRPPHTPESIQ